MALTTAQKATLKAAILADPVLNAFPNSGDGNFDLAVKLSTQLASPAFIVWRTSVLWDLIGDKINASELVGLTTGKLTQLQTLALISPNGVNASVQDRREAFDQIFSAASGTITRPALLAIWKRSATLIEKILATGTGSDVSPATMGFEGSISDADVMAARNS